MDGDAEGHRHGVVDTLEIVSGDRGADPLGDLARAGQVGVGEHGEELLTAIATDQVVTAKATLEDLRQSNEHGVTNLVTHAIVDALEVIDVGHDAGQGNALFARLIEALVEELEEVSAVVLENRITERPDGPQYTSREIVTYFSKRGTRAITRPKLDANIRFESNSAVLSDQAKMNLDVWGESFLHPYLKDAQFQIGGHTDDIGSDTYNLRLSQKRAESVKSYLSSRFEIDANRFEVVGHGEEAPKVDNLDSQSRAENRRVEFQQIND